MLTCPMCKKPLRGLEKQCGTCRSDLSLLVQYVDGLDEGLQRADALTRAGELGDAVWSYLEVLEVDPENPIARHQVGQVALAVRQFDRLAQGRRWRDRIGRRARLHHWRQGWRTEDGMFSLLKWGLVLLVGVALLVVGYLLGYQTARHQPLPSDPGPEQSAAP